MNKCTFCTCTGTEYLVFRDPVGWIVFHINFEFKLLYFLYKGFKSWEENEFLTVSVTWSTQGDFQTRFRDHQPPTDNQNDAGETTLPLWGGKSSVLLTSNMHTYIPWDIFIISYSINTLSLNNQSLGFIVCVNQQFDIFFHLLIVDYDLIYKLQIAQTR